MTFSSGDLKDLAALLRAVGQAEVMPRFRNLGPRAIRQKSGPLDLVTEADEAAEAAIEAGLRTRFPGCVVVGEEAATANPSLLGLLRDAELSFVVDPIDGTANFAAGLPLFGIMAAAIMRGAVIAAAIHDPVGDDTALALRDEGAWLEAPDGPRVPLSIARPVALGEMVGSASWRYMPEPQRQRVCGNLRKLGASWDYRCAAHEYRLAAAGHCHFLLFNRLMPWDHAPGWLLHREAGGYAARFDGSAYDPAETGGGLICAPDQASWTALQSGLLGSDDEAPADQDQRQRE